MVIQVTISSSSSETVNVDTRSSHIDGCQWLGNRQRQKYPRGLKPEANSGNLRVKEESFYWCRLHFCLGFARGKTKKEKRKGAMQHPELLWQVQRWPSSVRGDIWDGRYKAKALNENHLFWSELARGNLQQRHQ